MLVIQMAEVNLMYKNTNDITQHFIWFNKKNIIIMRTTDTYDVAATGEYFHLNSRTP